MELQATREAAHATVRKLIAVHEQSLKDIRDGKKLWKDGEDVTAKVYARIQFELKQCQMVDDALDHMKAGDIRRAAELCEQIKEFIG